MREGRQRAVKHVVKELLPQLLLDIISWLLVVAVLTRLGAPVGVFCGMTFDGGVGWGKQRRSIELCKSRD